MTRLTFKPEHVHKILNGTKTATFRRRLPSGLTGGGRTVAAVTSKDGKPAFLTKAEDAFAHLTVLCVDPIQFLDYNEQDAKEAGFTSLTEARAWYLATDPTLEPHSYLYRIRFIWVPMP